MNNKTISAIFLLLLASQGFILFLSPISNMGSEMNDNQEIAIDQNFEVSEVDLDRVNLQSEAFENGDVEAWDDPHELANLSTYRTTDRMSWYEQFGFVIEGTRALGMRARGADINYPAAAQIFLKAWNSIAAYNLTISLDWRVGQIGYPELGDRMELYLPFSDGRNVRYCMGEDISLTNTSSTVYYLIDDSPGTWHKLERNVTSDYIEAFGSEPANLNKFSFFAHSFGPKYTYGYFDDFYLVRNGTIIVGGGVNHGNFETSGTESYWYNFNTAGGFGDISSSTDRIEGDFSVNTTVISTSSGHRATSDCTADIYRMLSDENRDVFTFSWKVDDIQLAHSDTYSYIAVYITNATSSYSVYYVTAAGGSTIPDFRWDSEDIQFNMGNVNETGDWATLNTCIYEDILSVRDEENIYISNIEIHTFSEDPNAKLTVLYDNMSFISSTFSDRGYEHLGPLGSRVPGWYDEYYGCDYFTVTDFSYSGDKAGNFTMSDDNDVDAYVTFYDEVLINSENEMVLDITWYMDYNQSSEDYFGLYLDVGDYIFYYLIMNTTTLDEDIIDEDYCTFILPETNTEGEWVNWKIDIAHDYEQAVGEFPNTTLNSIEWWGYANVSSQFTVFIDDFYLYEDSAPEITDISHTPTSPEANENTEISVTVVDATALDVTLHHRTGTDDWTNTTMIDVGNNVFEANITTSPWDVEVEYYVTAIDAFNKTDEIMDGASYFTFTAVDTLAPIISDITPLNGSIINGSVFVNVSASDSGSGIDRVEIYVNEVLALNDTASPYSYELNTSTLEDGLHVIKTVAYDVAGNSNEVGIGVTVDNIVETTTTTTTTSTDTTTSTETTNTTTPPPSGDLLLPIVIIIITAVGAFVVLYFIVLKKK